MRQSVQAQAGLVGVLPGKVSLAGLEQAASAQAMSLPVFSFGHCSRCTYCGDPASDREHVIPVSYQAMNRKAAFVARGPWTWACRDCNAALWNRGFDTFGARCEWAHWRLNKRLQPIHWTFGELSALDYGLRKHVQHEMAKRKWLFHRADWYQSREYYLNLESLAWEANQRKPDTPGAQFILAYFSDTLRELGELYRNRSDSWNC